MLSRFAACSGVGLRCRKRGKALLHGDGADLIRYHAGGRRRVLRFVDRAPDDHYVRPRRERIGSLSSLGPHPRCQDETVADDSPERPDPVRSGRRRDDACRPGSDRDACELLRELRCELLASGMAEFRDDEDISRACCIDACADGILSREGMTDDAGRSRSDRLLDDEPARVRDVRNLEITQDVAKVRELAHDADARREDERPVHLDSIDVALNRLRDRPRSFDVRDVQGQELAMAESHRRPEEDRGEKGSLGSTFLADVLSNPEGIEPCPPCPRCSGSRRRFVWSARPRSARRPSSAGSSRTTSTTGTSRRSERRCRSARSYSTCRTASGSRWTPRSGTSWGRKDSETY